MGRILVNKPIVLVIVGPTASGKSNLAVHLAKKFGGEIISADSRQIYKGLDIGTNKITKREMKGVPHYLLDVASPIKRFSAADYKKLADKSLHDIKKKGKLPIIVGGTGFYIDVLAKKVSLPSVAPNSVLRKKLVKKNLKQLFKMLKEKDLRRAKTIDQYNKARLIRALEIVKALGKVPRIQTTNTRYRFIYIGLRLNKVALEKRIRTRLLKQLPSIIRESQKLQARGLSYKRMHELGLEYRYISMYLQNKLARKDMVEVLYIALRQYAKRQMTWFERNKEIKWFKPSETKKIEQMLNKILI